MSLKDKIVQAIDLPSEIVTIPEWEMTVKVRGMDVKSRIQWEKHIINSSTGVMLDDRNAYRDMIIPMLVVCLYDPETDEPIFASEEEGTEVLLGKNAAVLGRLAEKARQLSGIGTTEEQAKN